MKISTTVATIIVLSGCTSSVSAFAPSKNCNSNAMTLNMINNNDDNNENNNVSNRRNMLIDATKIGAAALLTTSLPLPAYADKRPTYLVEPTDEFKESERQRMEFRRNQLIVKQKMVTLLDKLSTEGNVEDALVDDLVQLKELVITCGGMPLGIKKDDLVKQVRAKKAKGYWPTNVEIAYQKLISEINYQQSPNKDKDIANPL